MKCSVTFESQASETDDLETFLDGIMDQLGSEPGTDPAIGATGSSGLVEVELVVDAPTLAEALARAASMIERATEDGPVTIERVGVRASRTEKIRA